MHEVVVIGGGHNGLVAACYLAKAGLKPIVLERRARAGGGAVTEEIHPGFRCPTLSHEVLLHERVAEELGLARHGLQTMAPDVEVCSLSARGPVVLHRNAGTSAEPLRRTSGHDADAYPEFRASMARVASVLAALLESPPPSIDTPDARDLWNLLRAGRRFRGLGKRDEYRLLRWGPMPIADLVTEWFEDEQVRAAVAAPALVGTMLGPRSAGGALVLLMREAHRLLAGDRTRARGGPGAVTQALVAAATAAGAEIRTGVLVERILVQDGRVAGVAAGGRELPARRVVSALDPKTTLLGLVQPTELMPDFAAKVRNYRAAGTLAKVNLALAGMPSFGVDVAALTGRIQIGPDLDFLERAFDASKYGELPAEPWLDTTIPSIADPELAPAGAHVASIYVHYVPYRLRSGDWDAARAHVLDATLAALERHAPGIRGLVVAAQVLTPLDLETEYGFAGGHIFHGELALDQLFTMRPLLGHARYTTPIPGLYLCSGGTHPGGFLTGASGRLAARAVLADKEP